MEGSEYRGNGRDGPGAEFALELPTDLRLIDTAVGYLVARCRDVGFDGQRLTLNFRVGIAEALANAMIYGNGRDPAKRVRVEVALSEHRVSVVVRDEGQGFDPGAVPDPTAGHPRLRCRRALHDRRFGRQPCAREQRLWSTPPPDAGR